MSIDIDALIDRECPTPMLYDKWRRWLVARIGDEIDQINTDRDTLTRENADLRARLADAEKARDYAEWGRDILKAEVLAWRGEIGCIDDAPEVFTAKCATDLSGVLTNPTAAAAVKEASNASE